MLRLPRKTNVNKDSTAALLHRQFNISTAFSAAALDPPRFLTESILIHVQSTIQKDPSVMDLVSTKVIILASTKAWLDADPFPLAWI